MKCRKLSRATIEKGGFQMRNGADNTFDAFLKGFTSVAGFSPEVFGDLGRDTSEEVALRILNQFRLSLEVGIERLDQSLQRKDGDLVAQVAHKLAGSAELIGFLGLGQNCRSAMAKLKQGAAFSQLESGILAIRTQCQGLLNSLQEHCPNLSSFI
ncbi:MAG: hypothetical protein C5B49_06720 [Bdellovibrio sp.]|nr:MAG: hypothetical protein C5B49_06720 [Bdellovibrio sp.]